MWRFWYVVYVAVLRLPWYLTGGRWTIHSGWLWRKGPKARRAARGRP